ncbi:RepA protein [Arboricoccus pini]|uniref:RepA protein n=1 Tax=Arboricoccus pini TaxID=1963835 RepID=A0A212RLI4_9PROT|nr:replication protein RepA [Arboricoccus pini]SNB73275.1 RepA protein [Arboricoccus pini]
MSDLHEKVRLHGRAVLASASSKAEKKALQLAMNFLADENLDAGFVHPSMCLTTLPHRATPQDEIWSRQGSFASLEVVPVRQKDGSYMGVPYGPKARLILLYLQAEAIKTGSRQVSLGKSMRGWLQAMGVALCGPNYKTVLEQARRIENCLIRFSYATEDGNGRWQDSIIRGSFDPYEGDGSVELSEGFYRALNEHPVPVAEAAIRHLADTCMPLDIYLWLAYRLHALKRPTMVSWQALHAQFGAATKELYHFKPRFRRDLELALQVYPDARVELDDNGARLWPSAPAVAKRTSGMITAA